MNNCCKNNLRKYGKFYLKCRSCGITYVPIERATTFTEKINELKRKNSELTNILQRLNIKISKTLKE